MALAQFCTWAAVHNVTEQVPRFDHGPASDAALSSMYEDVPVCCAVDLESQAVEPPAEPTSDALEAHLTQSFPVSSLQWSAIALTVKDQRTGSAKRLLQGCAGVAFPGDLVALVGPSGETLQEHPSLSSIL